MQMQNALWIHFLRLFVSGRCIGFCNSVESAGMGSHHRLKRAPFDSPVAGEGATNYLRQILQYNIRCQSRSGCSPHFTHSAALLSGSPITII